MLPWKISPTIEHLHSLWSLCISPPPFSWFVCVSIALSAPHKYISEPRLDWFIASSSMSVNGFNAMEIISHLLSEALRYEAQDLLNRIRNKQTLKEVFYNMSILLFKHVSRFIVSDMVLMFIHGCYIHLPFFYKENIFESPVPCLCRSRTSFAKSQTIHIYCMKSCTASSNNIWYYSGYVSLTRDGMVRNSIFEIIARIISSNYPWFFLLNPDMPFDVKLFGWYIKLFDFIESN